MWFGKWWWQIVQGLYCIFTWYLCKVEGTLQDEFRSGMGMCPLSTLPPHKLRPCIGEPDLALLYLFLPYKCWINSVNLTVHPVTSTIITLNICAVRALSRILSSRSLPVYSKHNNPHHRLSPPIRLVKLRAGIVHAHLHCVLYQVTISITQEASWSSEPRRQWERRKLMWCQAGEVEEDKWPDWAVSHQVQESAGGGDLQAFKKRNAFGCVGPRMNS